VADVADDPVALGQEPRVQPGDRELPGDQRGRLELVMGQLRVRVDVTAYGYQLGSSGRQPAVKLARKRVGPRRCIGPGRRRLAACRQRQRTRHVGISISVRWTWGRAILRTVTSLDQPRPGTVTLRNLILVVFESRSVTNVLVRQPVRARKSGIGAIDGKHRSRTSYNA
jgi:hypothetical protein